MRCSWQGKTLVSRRLDTQVKTLVVDWCVDFELDIRVVEAKVKLNRFTVVYCAESLVNVEGETGNC